MGIGVLVIVSFGKLAELPAESLAAGVVFARRAVAITPPIAKRFGDDFELVIVREHRPTLAHRNVMRGIKAERAQVTEGADEPPTVRCTQSVATVLDEPQVVLLAQRGDD